MNQIRHLLAQFLFIAGVICLLSIIWDPGDWLASIGYAVFCWVIMVIVAPRK
jgi:hypothetical protein